ncbi:MAG: type I-G CRISPR-associated protein Cas8g1/Csx17, partial [Pseudonocardiaceae bacterium]
VLGELWAPEWSAPARLDEVTHLVAEGRAEWNHHPASSGLDFVRAVATLGVDHGIDAFERHLFVDRHGQNPLALPAGRIVVCPRQGVGLLAALDRWLERLRRAELPSQVAARLRGVEQALFTHARSGEPDLLAEVIVAVGRCHEAVTRSGSVRQSVRPLVMSGGCALLDELRRATEGDAELRIALAFATARDRGSKLPLRTLLSPVTAERFPAWTNRPALAPLSSGLAAALAEVARRRAFPGAIDEVKTDLVPAVKGVRIGYQWGVRITAEAAQSFVAGELDDDRLADLLAGLLTVDWADIPEGVVLRGAERSPDPALGLLLPFTGTTPVRLPEKEVLLRPGSEWPVLLSAGRTVEVLADAARRLRIAGLRDVITPGAAPYNGARLAAVLMMRVPDGDRQAALRRVAVFPEPTSEQNQEIPA